MGDQQGKENGGTNLEELHGMAKGKGCVGLECRMEKFLLENL